MALGFRREGDGDDGDGDDRRCDYDAVRALAARHGFVLDTRFGNVILMRRVTRGPAKLVGRWLVISEDGDLPCTVRTPVELSVYEHCEEYDGPAFAGQECGDGWLSSHNYPSLVVAFAAIDALGVR